MSKHINFSAEQEKAIQNYANSKYDGNFTRAVQELCANGMKPKERRSSVRMLEEKVERLTKELEAKA